MWLWGLMTATGGVPAGSLRSSDRSIALAALARRSALDDIERVAGRCVLVAVSDQLSAAVSLIELDGVARRIVLWPPGLGNEHIRHVISQAEVEICLTDSVAMTASASQIGIESRMFDGTDLSVAIAERRQAFQTEWVLLTSGTTGTPKLVLHTLATLTDAFRTRVEHSNAIVWGTFYDIRRYGGLQILLRALCCGSMVLSSATESVAEFLARLRGAGATHVSGTPSQWRRVLMSGDFAGTAPRYIRLSGEVADQSILDSLRAAFPSAIVAHAFASTEAGVGFEVEDGRAGFPATLIGYNEIAELKVVDGTLRVRSDGNAVRYLGAGSPNLRADDGFVNTGDRVEERDGRYVFKGRVGGVINVGGLKVYPEEVEAVINSHPWVEVCRVSARRSPITGAVVTAEVVAAVEADDGSECPSDRELTNQIVEICRAALEPYKVPATIRIVRALEVSASGKLVRPNA